MKIFFVGFMGCGKTTWGRKLANRLEYDFVDLDKVFEEKVGTSITQYFEEHGQDAFRLLESKILKETEYAENVVVSTGGGLPVFFDNMEWMNANGQSIYIKLTPATLAERLDKGKTTRPLILGKHGEELVAFITEKLAERESFYEKATHIVNGIEMTPDSLAELVTK
ncbi:shikimate kinase [Mucilaginibacter auburnensis]|uniref:Shikimate kinase n=1 Tax=Mucilaginibacter auburnensis TaxID=1457233 RepID=A0A2H9VQQ8_9SPHI|nr:shikimate kinase [Mucilaginibacter auburnensis]PJJ83161.1 shikimate kinase [Mucilaginibacter auburnensis]